MSASIETIPGQMYEAPNGTIRNPTKNTCMWIFVRDCSLNICELGYVEKANRHYMTFAAFKVASTITKQINEERRHLPLEQVTSMIDKAEEEANKNALIAVELPKKKIEEIQTLHLESTDPNTPKDRLTIIKAKIAQLIRESGFFPQKGSKDAAK